jgi:hypothetical protein
VVENHRSVVIVTARTQRGQYDHNPKGRQQGSAVIGGLFPRTAIIRTFDSRRCNISAALSSGGASSRRPAKIAIVFTAVIAPSAHKAASRKSAPRSCWTLFARSKAVSHQLAGRLVAVAGMLRHEVRFDHALRIGRARFDAVCRAMHARQIDHLCQGDDHLAAEVPTPWKSSSVRALSSAARTASICWSTFTHPVGASKRSDPTAALPCRMRSRSGS